MSSPRSLKVVHITRAEVLGIRTFLCALLSHTDRSRFRPVVASPGTGPLPRDLERMGIRTLACPLERDIRLLRDAASLVSICRLLRRERPDIVHLHGAKAGFLGRIAAAACRVPVVVYTPNNDYLDEPMPRLRRYALVALERLVARLGGLVVSVSQEERQSWIDRGICSPDRIVTIHDGFDFSRAARLVPGARARQLLGIPPDCPVAGLIARLVPQKAPHVFLRSAAAVLRQRPDAHFLVVGDGPLDRDLRRLAAELGIAGNVHFLGFAEDLSTVYSALHVCVLTSLYEGLPMVVLESMFLGIPVVASQAYGVNEVLSEGCGVITPVLDPEATARAMLRVFAGGPEVRAMCDAARRRVVASFGAPAMALKYQDLYLRLCGAAGPADAARGDLLSDRPSPVCGDASLHPFHPSINFHEVPNPNESLHRRN